MYNHEIPSEVTISSVKPLKTDDGYFCPFCGKKLKYEYTPLSIWDDTSKSYVCDCSDWLEMEEIMLEAEKLFHRIPTPKHKIVTTSVIKKM